MAAFIPGHARSCDVWQLLPMCQDWCYSTSETFRVSLNRFICPTGSAFQQLDKISLSPGMRTTCPAHLSCALFSNVWMLAISALWRTFVSGILSWPAICCEAVSWGYSCGVQLHCVMIVHRPCLTYIARRARRLHGKPWVWSAGWCLFSPTHSACLGDSVVDPFVNVGCLWKDAS